MDHVGGPGPPRRGWWVVLAIRNRAGQNTPPVGAEAAREPPVIALFRAPLALRASDCNGRAQQWVLGQGCKLDRERWQAAGFTEARRQGRRQLVVSPAPSLDERQLACRIRRARLRSLYEHAGNRRSSYEPAGERPLGLSAAHRYRRLGRTRNTDR